MCYSVGNSLTEKTFTGYKVVNRDKHGHLYSAFTGVRYEAGKTMKHPKKVGKYATWIFDFPCYVKSTNYNENAIGRTAVFTSCAAAEQYAYDLAEKFTALSIAKITISGDLKAGAFWWRDVVSGTKIESVKFIKKIKSIDFASSKYILKTS